ncbi:MAG TPA: hypothetical protein VGE60_00125 [Telluria sp.]
MFRVPEMLVLTDLVRRLKKTEGALPAFQQQLGQMIDDGVVVAAGERGPEVVFPTSAQFAAWSEMDHPFGVRPPRKPRFIRMKAVRYEHHHDVPDDHFVITAASVDPATNKLHDREWSGYSRIDGETVAFVLKDHTLSSVYSKDGRCNLHQKALSVGEFFSCWDSDTDDEPFEYRIVAVTAIDE